VPLQPRRTVDELRELHELTGDENGAQRVAWTETWERAREWLRGKVAESVAAHRADLGILVCGTGIGMAMSANKVPGIRAANVSSEFEAQMAREHNNANVLTLGARILKDDDARKIVDKWLHTQFAGGRHQQRVDKIMALEAEEKSAADQP